MKLPTEFEVFIDDAQARVRYDYDLGESQWFDARAGVGSPGYDASVWVTEINFDLGGGWELPDAYPELDFDAVEQQIMDKIIELESAEQAARDEAEYNAYNERIA